MAVTKLGISFPVELVREIDSLAKGFKKSRSEVIREAATKMIIDYRKQQAIGKAEKIYKEIAGEDKRLAEDFIGICAEPAAKYSMVRKTKKK
jgi:metal-responsive CopG/Arc/MetJ family transcriptional regulator